MACAPLSPHTHTNTKHDSQASTEIIIGTGMGVGREHLTEHIKLQLKLRSQHFHCI